MVITGLAAVLFISVVGIGAGKGWYAVYSRMSAIDALGVTLTSLLILVPMAALEEIAVRGYLLQTLKRSLGRWGAVLVSSKARVSNGFVGVAVAGRLSLEGTARALVSVSLPMVVAAAAGFGLGLLLGRRSTVDSRQ